MRILILGGTGAMGEHLVQLLLDNDIDTTVTSRSNQKSEGKIKYIQGNAHDLSFLETVLEENYDVIIDFMVYTTSSFNERVDLLLKATKQYIFLSSARVYADSKPPITELSPRLLDVSQDKDFLETDEYSLTKARQEDILRNSSYENWTIIRPYITYSKNRLQLGVLEKEDWLYRALRGRTIVFSKDINLQKTTLTYGLDVAKGIAAIMGKSNALGNTFHITANELEAKTWNTILNIYLKGIEAHLGYKPKILLLDTKSFLELRPYYARYQVLYDRCFDRVFDCSKISQYVDTNNFIQPEKGLEKCLRDFLKTPHFLNINWQEEAKRDRQTGERTPLKEIQGFKQKIKYLIYRYIYNN